MINKYLKTSLNKIVLVGLLAFILFASVISPGKLFAYSDYLCTTGNYSNTKDGCQNQSGTAPVSDALRKTCDTSGSTADQRKTCIASNTVQPEFKKSDCKGPNIKAGLQKNDPNHCGILDYLQIFINALSALVGVVIVISIIVGGIQYSASGDDPQAVARAKSRIVNAILALILFIFSFAILQWLIPGGLF